MSQRRKGRHNKDRFLGMAFGSLVRVKEYRIAGPCREAVCNAVDARATYVRIFIDKKKQRLIIIDDGMGFDDDRMESFFLVGDSIKRASEGNIGRNGTGRLSFLSSAAEIAVYSVSEGFPQGVSFSLRRKDIEKSFPDDWEFDYKEGRSARRPDCIDASFTRGSVLIVQGFTDWSEHMDTPAKLRDKLMRILPISMTRMVTVDGEKVPEKSSHSRVYEKKVDHPLLGKCHAILFIPTNPGRDDTVQVGGYIPMCPVSQMKGQFPRGLRADLPEFVSTVVGDLLIPWLNQFRDDTSAGFTDELCKTRYRKQHEAVVALLRDFATESKELFLQHAEEAAVEEGERALNDGAKRWNDSNFDPREYGDDEDGGAGDKTKHGGSPTSHAPFSVTESEFRLPPEESITFSVVTRIGGYQKPFAISIDPPRAAKVRDLGDDRFELTAGKTPKTFTVTVAQPAEPTGFTIELPGEVTKEKDLDLTPGRRTIYRGEERLFRVRNPRLTSGGKNLEYSVDASTSSIRILASRDGFSVKVRVKDTCKYGTYPLTVRDTQSGLESTADIVVSRRPPRSTLLQVQDKVYKLEAIPVSQQPDLLRFKETSADRQTGKRIDGTFTVRWDHPILKGLFPDSVVRNRELRDRIRFQHVLSAIVTIHFERIGDPLGEKFATQQAQMLLDEKMGKSSK